MTANKEPIFGLTPKCAPVTILPADTTTKKTVYTGGADGGRIEAINVATDETANRDMQVFFTVGGVDYLIGTVQIPLGSGNTSGVVSVNVLDVLKIPGLDASGAWTIPSTVAVKVAMAATITAAKTMWITPRATDF